MSQHDQLRIIRRKLFLLGLFKIPMIGFVRPRLLQINDNEVKVMIRLKRRTRNHLNSMYFGALSIGADIASGIHVFYFSEQLKHKVSFAFKSIDGQFLQRAESDVVFSCNQGKRIREMILSSKESGERINELMDVIATNSSGEVVATFKMGVSIRVK